MINKSTLWLLAAFAFTVITQESCHKQERCDKPLTNDNKSCFKGKLEIAGICMNYTIKVLEGNIDPALVESAWTNPHTGKSYTNVFGLQSICTFPSDIKEGDEFYFEITNTGAQECAVCKAIYPTPAKKLAINVMKTGCSQITSN